MKERLKSILKLIIMLFLFFNIDLFIKRIVGYIGVDYSILGYKDIFYFTCLSDGILLIILTILYEKSISKDWYIVKEKFKIAEFLKYLIIFMGAKILSAVVSALISVVLSIDLIESQNQSIIEMYASMSPLLMLICSCITAPIIEEGIFRLGFRKVIKNDYLFIVISGFVFGLMHIFPTDIPLALALTQGITYIVIGAVLAAIYVKTDNIWYVILIHALNNVLGMMMII